MTALPETGTVRIRTDRGAVDRWRPTPVVAYGVAAAITLSMTAWSVAAGVAYVAILFSPVALLELILAGQAWASWQRLRRIEAPIELSPSGVVLRTERGEVHAPWSEVTGAGLRRDGLVTSIGFRMAPGTVTGLPRRQARFAERRGLVYALRVLDVDPDVLAAELTRASAGRF